MKRHKSILMTLLLLTVIAFSLSSASIGESVVLRLVAYIPERTTFTATDEGIFLVDSNANNFTYTVEDSPMTRTLFVVAN